MLRLCSDCLRLQRHSRTLLVVPGLVLVEQIHDIKTTGHVPKLRSIISRQYTAPTITRPNNSEIRNSKSPTSLAGSVNTASYRPLSNLKEAPLDGDILASSTLYVAGLPGNVNRAQLEKLFGGFGQIIGMVIGRGKSDNVFASTTHRSYARIQFGSTSSAERVLHAHQKHEIRIDNALSCELEIPNNGGTLIVQHSKRDVVNVANPSSSAQPIIPTSRLFFVIPDGKLNTLKKLLGDQKKLVKNIRFVSPRLAVGPRAGLLELASTLDAAAVLQHLRTTNQNIIVSFAQKKDGKHVSSPCKHSRKQNNRAPELISRSVASSERDSKPRNQENPRNDEADSSLRRRKLKVDRLDALDW